MNALGRVGHLSATTSTPLLSIIKESFFITETLAQLIPNSIIT